MIVEDLGGMQAICQALHTNARLGIRETEVNKRTQVYGRNWFPPPQIASIYDLIMENFEDPINVILLGAAFVAVICGLV